MIDSRPVLQPCSFSNSPPPKAVKTNASTISWKDSLYNTDYFKAWRNWLLEYSNAMIDSRPVLQPCSFSNSPPPKAVKTNASTISWKDSLYNTDYFKAWRNWLLEYSNAMIDSRPVLQPCSFSNSPPPKAVKTNASTISWKDSLYNTDYFKAWRNWLLEYSNAMIDSRPVLQPCSFSNSPPPKAVKTNASTISWKDSLYNTDYFKAWRNWLLEYSNAMIDSRPVLQPCSFSNSPPPKAVKTNASTISWKDSLYNTDYFKCSFSNSPPPKAVKTNASTISWKDSLYNTDYFKCSFSNSPPPKAVKTNASTISWKDSLYNTDYFKAWRNWLLEYSNAMIDSRPVLQPCSFSNSPPPKAVKTNASTISWKDSLYNTDYFKSAHHPRQWKLMQAPFRNILKLNFQNNTKHIMENINEMAKKQIFKSTFYGDLENNIF
ncbi:hypothetical protein BY458DRAFT_487763 [Sporodiniella umbellata]|nr:hypothetical protein BY458DRAFT_487763 [Sporodiniella umbellata]